MQSEGTELDGEICQVSTFFATLEPDISLISTAIKRANEITQWVMKTNDATMPRIRLFPKGSPIIDAKTK